MGKHYTPVCAAQVLPLNSLPMINMTRSLWAKENVWLLKAEAQYQMVDEAFNKFVVFPQPIGIWQGQGHLHRESFTILSDTILSIYEHSIQQRGLDQLCSSWLPLFNWVDLDQIFTFKHNWAQRVVTFLWSFWLVLEIFATYHAHCAMHDLSYSWNMFSVVQYNVYVFNKPSWDLIFWENLPSENVYNLMFVLFKYFNMLTTLLVLYPPADVVVKFLSIVFFRTCAKSCSTQSRTQVTGVQCKVNGLSWLALAMIQR